MTNSLDDDFKEVAHFIEEESHYMYGVDENVMNWLKPETLYLIEMLRNKGSTDDFVHRILKDYCDQIHGSGWYKKLINDFQEGRENMVNSAKIQIDHLQKKNEDGKPPYSEL